MALSLYKIPRFSKGKLLIPVGWNQLSIRKVEERTSSSLKRMVVLTLHCKPSDKLYGEPLEERTSFQMIERFHFEGEGNVKTWWHRMSNMPSNDLDALHAFKGKVFMALIKHTQYLLQKDGKRITDGRDVDKYFWAAEIVTAAPMSTTLPTVDMERLVEWLEPPLAAYKTKGVKALVDTFDLKFERFVIDKTIA